MVALGLISEDEARQMLQSTQTTGATVAGGGGIPPTPPPQPDQPLVLPQPPPPMHVGPSAQPHRPILSPQARTALTADLHKLVATSVMTEDEALRMMLSGVSSKDSNAILAPPRQPDPPVQPLRPAAAAAAAASATTTIAAATIPAQIHTNNDPIPPASLSPLTADLLEMVRNGVMSEEDAHRMMGSPETLAAMAANLAKADEKVRHDCIFVSILLNRMTLLHSPVARTRSPICRDSGPCLYMTWGNHSPAS